MSEFEKIQELLLEKESKQQKWNLEQDDKNKELHRVYTKSDFLLKDF